MPTEFLTIADVATQLKCSHAFVYQMARQNKVPVSRIGKRLLFIQKDIDEYIKSNTLPAKDTKRAENA